MPRRRLAGVGRSSAGGATGCRLRDPNRAPRRHPWRAPSRDGRRPRARRAREAACSPPRRARPAGNRGGSACSGAHDHAARRATITADDPGVQLLVSRRDRDGTIRDLTRRLSGGSSRRRPPRSSRRLSPAASGRARSRSSPRSRARKSAATVKIEPRRGPLLGFRRGRRADPDPAGLQHRGCHGKADGQNGFHLSLSGYDPEGDYQALVRDVGQRRVSLLAPEQSLFLTKATGRTPHMAAARGSRSARPNIGCCWTGSGPGHPGQRGKSHGAVVRLSVEPGSVRLAEPGPQQLRVVAEYADGHRRDVTRQASSR